MMTRFACDSCKRLLIVVSKAAEPGSDAAFFQSIAVDTSNATPISPETTECPHCGATLYANIDEDVF